jgi:hypothetical protein
MPAFLITGNPGSGKSALGRELTRRGSLAIDPDHDPELSHWEDAAGHRVRGPQRPDEQWLGSHRWVWSRCRMEEILAGHDRPVFVCGIARNQEELLDLFDRVFLLHIDAQTQEARLAAHDALNPPGRSEAGRQEIREGRAVFEAQMLRHGAIAIDATRPGGRHLTPPGWRECACRTRLAWTWRKARLFGGPSGAASSVRRTAPAGRHSHR